MGAFEKPIPYAQLLGQHAFGRQLVARLELVVGDEAAQGGLHRMV